MKQNQNDEMKLTYTGVFVKNGQRHVSVRFERGGDVAEAVLPECKVTKSSGFDEGEVAALELYLRQENDDIFLKAKEITGIRHMI